MLAASAMACLTAAALALSAWIVVTIRRNLIAGKDLRFVNLHVFFCGAAAVILPCLTTSMFVGMRSDARFTLVMTILISLFTGGISVGLFHSSLNRLYMPTDAEIDEYEGAAF